MTFNSMQFVLFFTIVFLAYWRLGFRNQNRLLLAASYLFYGWWDWRFLGLMLLSSSIDYFCGLGLGRTDDPSKRKRLLWTSMTANLVILGFFKYFNFFIDSLDSGLDRAGVDWLAPSLGIVLPVGISFYTFQSMSYGIDVYRRELKPIRSFFDFALFVSYFPQLVAGPIERATALAPQITTPRLRPDKTKVVEACSLILVGLVKKVVVADLAAEVANDVFSRSGEAGFFELLIGVYCFAIQIYGDFSGYSDMARGVSRLLGIELMENFKQPYFSATITDFWRRWHISLSQWLRDYLYIPLGGNRKGPRRTYINLGVTMLLGGLWHGAAWTFVVWGALQGLYLMGERAMGFDKGPASRGAVDRPDAVHVPSHLSCVDLLPGRQLRPGLGRARGSVDPPRRVVPDARLRQLLPAHRPVVDRDRPSPTTDQERPWASSLASSDPGRRVRSRSGPGAACVGRRPRPLRVLPVLRCLPCMNPPRQPARE